ncbi:NAD-dependent epimerase/dehydratase family protein [Pseudoclavibacter chungangensis]|uniref:UDP-glucuronate decarboxylase n=1 Tax=Pseudoclavibacter chungangensis TaxID=587635 RepID=A0A7J5C1P5_9MICO|nr:GDP-mannose 4,6-dehydratase [Pseudoclavibacter chungangensis]KAB1662557.1 NAD-dependent epimerase/dehydratase family protein [Pseudoclavibacter chungangensis]NYJ68601.1 UDP-glucose 4-epimerase [Pseudoclavibacter chungangensis]
MRILITGGAGFIGSHLVDLLVERGDDVVVLDDLSTGRLDNLARHTSGESGPGTFRFEEGNVLDRALVDRLIGESEYVLHLAAAVGVHTILNEPLRSLRTNIHGTENVLDAAVAHHAKMLLVSTSEIYGKNTSDKLDEGADRILGSPLTARWTYAAAKGIDESFAQAYGKELGLEVAIARPFNTVGPRQTGRYGMVVPNLVRQALAGEPLTVYGDGSQTRCFGFVGEVAPAMVALVETPAAQGRAVNLGGAREVSILELARTVIEVTGSTSDITLVPYSEAYGEGYEDMQRRVPDNTLAGEIVGYEPKIPLEEIIETVAEDQRNRSTIAETVA